MVLAEANDNVGSDETFWRGRKLQICGLRRGGERRRWVLVSWVRLRFCWAVVVVFRTIRTISNLPKAVTVIWECIENRCNYWRKPESVVSLTCAACDEDIFWRVTGHERLCVCKMDCH
mgnify:CR=1 FL=1